MQIFSSTYIKTKAPHNVNVIYIYIYILQYYKLFMQFAIKIQKMVYLYNNRHTIYYLLTGCQRSRSRIDASSKFFIDLIKTITIIANHYQLVNELLSSFFFLNLLVNKPLKH